jgi:hypothetical protein
MAHDVFISYSAQDKPIADAICANIEAAGVRCWISPRDIAPGEDWPAAIATAISQSRIMVLVFSTSSNASDDVGREIILAANHRLVIIPFKIDNVEPEPGKQYYLARTHWLDAVNPPTQAQINALVERVKMLVPGGEALPRANPPDVSRAPRLGGERSRLPRLVLAPIGVLLVGIMAWAALRSMAPASPTLGPTQPAPPVSAASPMAATVVLVSGDVPSATVMAEAPQGTPVPLLWEVQATEDFSSNRNGWPHAEQMEDKCSTFTRGVQDGALRWEMDAVAPNGCGYMDWAPRISAVSDFDVALDVVRSAGAADAGFGIAFRISNGNNFYTFAINDVLQTYRVMLIQNGSNTMVIDWTYDPVILSGEINRLGVSARGPALYFFINGSLVNSAVNTAIESGHVGICAETYGRGQVSIVYDDLSLDGMR